MSHSRLRTTAGAAIIESEPVFHNFQFRLPAVRHQDRSHAGPALRMSRPTTGYLALLISLSFWDGPQWQNVAPPSRRLSWGRPAPPARARCQPARCWRYKGCRQSQAISYMVLGRARLQPEWVLGKGTASQAAEKLDLRPCFERAQPLQPCRSGPTNMRALQFAGKTSDSYQGSPLGVP